MEDLLNAIEKRITDSSFTTTSLTDNELSSIRAFMGEYEKAARLLEYGSSQWHIGLKAITDLRKSYKEKYGK